EKINASGNPIKSVSVIMSFTKVLKLDIFDDARLGGKICYFYKIIVRILRKQRGVTLLGGEKTTPNANGQYWFWYVAPDDFTKPGLPQGDGYYNNESERYVAAKFTVTFDDGTSEQFIKWITIVRPPLMLVHGLNGSETSWSKSLFGTTNVYKDLFKEIEFAHISPKESFAVNARILLGEIGVGEAIDYGGGVSNFPDIITRMRLKGYVCNRVEYVAHSMGGNVLRKAETQGSLYYVGGNLPKNSKIMAKDM
ncbi:MAG: hypothetical protein IPO04_17365, partial [Cytophagaceae bacterium]|nr:hypothetical protein [Cytophagaceae bacterium]